MPYGAVIDAKDGAVVKVGQTVAKWDLQHPSDRIGSGRCGSASSTSADGITVQEQIDELTGLASAVVTDPKRRGSGAKDPQPMVRIRQEGRRAAPAGYRHSCVLPPAGAIVSSG